MKIRASFFRAFVLLCLLRASHCLADDFIYVANQTDGTVSVVDQALNTVIATVTVGPGPFDMVITPDGLTVFVLNNNNTISVIDASTSAFAVSTLVTGPIPAGNWGGLGIDTTPNLYLSIASGAANSHIAQFSGVSPFPFTGNAIITVPSSFPSHIAILPDGSKGYAGFTAGGVNNGVAVIDTTPTTFVTTISTGANNLPLTTAAATTTAGPFVFVAVNAPVFTNPGTLQVIDPSTDIVVASVTISNRVEAGLAISPIVAGKQFAYVTDDLTTVDIVDITHPATPVLSSSVTVGNTPDAIAITTDGLFAYVANFSDNTLSVLNISNPGSPVVLPLTIGVGGGPDAIVTGPASFTPVVITPPTNLTGAQKKNDFGLIYELFNLLQWQPGTTAAASFNIYRDGVLIANVSGTTTKYEDHDRKKNVATTYAVTSVSSSGAESSPITVVVN